MEATAILQALLKHVQFELGRMTNPADRYYALQRIDKVLAPLKDGLKAELLEAAQDGEPGSTSDGLVAFVLQDRTGYEYDGRAVQRLLDWGVAHPFIDISRAKVERAVKEKRLTRQQAAELDALATAKPSFALLAKVVETAV